uniref:Defensin-like protein n=1 Tax=Ipomoea trifida TaxID=35884 RepID=A4PHP9_IPOTF|nr:defensin-like protein [Ipomoea trifida]
MEHLIKLFAIIFLLLALCYSAAEAGGICGLNKTLSKLYKGECLIFDDGSCKLTCHKENFKRGKCVISKCCCYNK